MPHTEKRFFFPHWIPLFLCLAAWLCLPAADASPPPAKNAESAPVPLEIRVKKALAENKLDDQLRLLSDAGGSLSLGEIPRALALAAQMKSLRERGVFRESVWKCWARQAPEAAFDAAIRLPESRDKTSIVVYSASQWARKNPSEAAAAVLKLSPGRSQHDAVEAVAGIWAESSPENALKWAENLSYGATKQSALNSIRFVWVHSDPRSAAAHVTQTVEQGPVKNALLTNIANEWAILDPAAAIFWAKNLKYPPERSLALQNAVESWANRKPRAAADYAMKADPPGLRDQMVVAVLERWATQDPVEASEWTARIGDPELRRRGIAAVLDLWAMVEPLDCSKWLENRKASPFRSTAVESYVQAVTPWYPELGLKMVSRLAPETAGEPQVEACARQWLQFDPPAAGLWIAEASFPQDIKARWCSPVRN